MKKKLLTLLFTFYILLTLGQTLPAGSVDDTFKIIGSGFNAGVRTLATQADGKVLVGGTFSSYNGTSNYKIARLNSDGSLDSTFQFNTEITGEGIVLVYLGAIKILSNGKILIGFDVQTNSTRLEATSYVYRLNTNGAIDTSFSTITFKGGTNTNVCDIKFIETLPNNDIIVGGSFAEINGKNQSNLASFNSNGALLTSFKYPNSTIFFSTVNSLKVQSDGKVLVGGRTFLNSSTETRGLVRINSNGSIDNSFNTNAPDTFVQSIDSQDDGKILIQDTKFYRLNANGTTDTSFISPSINANIESMAIQNDGKIIIAGGFTNVAGLSRNRIARINSDGILDSSFDPGTGANDFIYDVSIQSDGKILIGGSFTSFNGENHKYIARLLSVGMTYMPDDNFEKYFVDRGYDDVLDDYILTSKIDTFINLTVSDLEISDLTGISDFKSLQNLDCENNNLTALDISKNENLTFLVCSHNRIRNLVLNDNISSVYARDNNLTSLDLSKQTNLTLLHSFNNLLTNIDVSNNLKLRTLETGNNPINTIDVSKNSELEAFYVYETNVKSIDLRLNTKLKGLAVVNNPELEMLYIDNGNNHNITQFLATGTPKLTCIQVDDVNFAETNLTSKDSHTSFSKVCNPTPFITKWRTQHSTVSTITIPTEGSGYNYTVDWGDGTIENNFTGDATHTYGVAGEFTVTITGSFPRIRFNIIGNIVNNTLVEIVQWGSNTWTTMEGAFAYCSELDVTATDTPDLSNVTSTKSMFFNCRKLIGNSSFNNWDVSTIQDFESMFNTADKFNTPLDNWNVSNVTNMKDTFKRADAFNQNINSWNVAAVLDMSGMFNECEDFNQPLNLWDVSKVENMSAMFRQTGTFNQELNSWDVSKVADMSTMFSGSSFNQELNSWDVSSVTDMKEMFADSNYNNIIADWNVGSVENMSGMFLYTPNFNSDITKWDVSEVTDMSYMFNVATVFNQNLGNWNVSHVTDMTYMFHLWEGGISTQNYDLTLNGWSKLSTLQTNVQLDATNIKYCNSENAKTILINNFGWQISDAGKDCTGQPVYFSISDTNFEQALIDLGFDTNGLNGNILNSDADKIITLNIYDPENNSNLPNVNSKLTDLTGIEGFVNLESLRCYNNNLTNLDLSKNIKLRYVNCKENSLESLNLANGNNSNMASIEVTSNPNLTCIQVDNQQYSLDNWIFIDAQTGFSEDCSQNDAVSNYYTTVTDTDFEKVLLHYNIDDVVDGKFITKNAYYTTELSTDWNNLAPKDLNGIEAFKSLKKLQSVGYNLEKIDLSQNVKLEELTLDGKIDSLNLKNLINLKKLSADGAGIKFIYLKDAINLEYLYLPSNELESIDVSKNTKLTFISVVKNNLKSLDVSKNTLLEKLGCYDNEIKYLDLSNLDALYDFSAQRNNLKYLNIKNGGNKNMSNFYVKENPYLTCIQVDDETWSSTYWGSTKDNTASFSNECSDVDLPVNVSGMWNDPANWASGVVPTSTDNVIIPVGTTLQISDDISEINSLENDGTIVINSTFSLKSNNNMVNNGTIVMNSDNDDSSVLFVVGTSTGEVKYSRGGLKANLWSLVTPPVSGQKIKEFATNVDNDIRINETVSPIRYAISYYDDKEPSGSKWKYFTESIDTEDTFTAGESYGLSRATDGSVTFTGTLTTNNSVKTLKPGEWNAIGNPFTTYYPANKNGASSFINDNYDILDDEFKGLYIWDSRQNKYVVVSEVDIQNRSITPGQGFFIKVKAGENTIEFKEAKRSLKPTTGDNTFTKEVHKYIKLLANNGTYTVTTDVKFLSNATKGFDIGLDIGNFSASSFDVYTHLVDESTTNNYTIQSLPIEDKEEVIIPISILSNKSEVYLSSLHENLPENIILLLEDRENNVFTDITNKENDYKISFNDTKNTEKIFYLHISYSSALSIDDSAIDKIQVYAANKTLFIKGLKDSAAIELYNILGQRVFKIKSTKDQNINLPMNLKEGVYTVKLSSENNIVTKKIVIN